MSELSKAIRKSLGLLPDEEEEFAALVRATRSLRQAQRVSARTVPAPVIGFFDHPGQYRAARIAAPMALLKAVVPAPSDRLNSREAIDARLQALVQMHLAPTRAPGLTHRPQPSPGQALAPRP